MPMLQAGWREMRRLPTLQQVDHGGLVEPAIYAVFQGGQGTEWLASTSFSPATSRTTVGSGDTLRTSVLRNKVHLATDIGKFF